MLQDIKLACAPGAAQVAWVGHGASLMLPGTMDLRSGRACNCQCAASLLCSQVAKPEHAIALSSMPSFEGLPMRKLLCVGGASFWERRNSREVKNGIEG